MNAWTPAQQLRITALGLLGALGVSAYFDPRWGMALVCVSACLWLIWRHWFLIVFALCGAALLYAPLRVAHDKAADQLATRVGQSVALRGVVSSFPDARTTSTRVRVQVADPGGQLLAVLPAGALVQYADEIELTGMLAPPQNFGDFDYRHHLEKSGIRVMMPRPEHFSVLSHDSKTMPMHTRLAARVRQRVSQALVLPTPHKTLALGVLVGVRDPLPRWTQQAFADSGLTHLLVVSGINVLYVTLLVWWILSWGPRWLRFVGAIVAVGGYVLVTGAEPPVVRAGLMGLISGLAVASGRPADGRTGLLVSLLCIGIINPLMLRADAGLHLSALATAGILWLEPWFRAHLTWVPRTLGLRTVTAVTLAAQTAVMPLLSLSFGTWPWASVFANLLTEPLTPLIMLTSLAGIAVGLVHPPIAALAAAPAYLFTELLTLIATVFSWIPSVRMPVIIAELWLLCVLVGLCWWAVMLAPGRRRAE